MTEPGNLTSLTANFIITDSAGGLWGSAIPTMVCYNGIVRTNTAIVALLHYDNHAVYQQNTAGVWFVYRLGTRGACARVIPCEFGA